MAYFNEAYIEEYQVLQEMHFSKKDLQDPATIDRILKGKENFETALKFTNYLLMAASVATNIILSIVANKKLNLKANGFPTHSTSLFIGILDTILAKKIGQAVKALPEKQYNKNIEKFKTKIKALIAKMEKAKQNDPENADKYQKVIDNCKNTLAEFDRRKAKAEKEKFDGMVEGCKGCYEDLCYWKDNIHQLGHTGDGGDFEMFQLANEYGIPEQDIINWAVNHGKKISCEHFQSVTSGDEPDPDIDFCKDFNNSDIIWFSSDDEDNTFIVCNNKKFYSTDCSTYEQDSIYKEAKRYGETDKDVLIEFDKEMGFYKFSECPENVKRNEFISFKK